MCSRTAVFVLLTALTGIQALAQGPETTAPLQVFIDCESYLCDFDYFRTEVPFVNYVRDRQDADAHVLVTTQPTGGGGTAFEVTFIGRGRFADLEETLPYASDATATEDEIRRGLTRVLRAGLLRFISRTPMLERFEITYDAPDVAAPQTEAVDDPWNYWVFNTRVNGFARGEDRYQFLNLYGSASASRVTEALKLRFGINGSRRAQTFVLSDGTETEDVQESYGANALSVWSLGPHWSAGGSISATRSSRLNQDLALELAPAIEYNVFPYDASTRKLLTFRYAVGLSHFDYADTTLFNRIEETRFRHSLSSVISFRQPWGNVGVSFDGQQFFFDLSKFNLNLGGNMEMRLFRGFSVNVGGNVAFVRDQLYLAKGNASDEDVLLRRRELQTDWRYFMHFGIGYRFGSKFNNVVNPRFGGGERIILF